jgi:hypothetical protein
MKILSLSCGGLALTLLVAAQAQTIPLYENFGVITFPPQIDAFAFANYGTFSVGTILPFDFQNTVNFTNTGTMSGRPGFEFDTASSIQPRQMAASFYNRSGATVNAIDLPIGASQLNGLPTLAPQILPSYLLVSATNVANQGLLNVGAGGRLRLEGKRLDLSRGGLNVQPIQGIGDTGPIFTNYYAPDLGIYDNYWALTNDVINSSGIVRGATVVSPPHVVTNGNFVFFQQLVLNNPWVSVFTNVVDVTNVLIQVAFVAPAPRIDTQIRFARSQILTNQYKSIAVALSLTDTNVVTGVPDVQTLYFSDRLVSDTNDTVLINFVAYPFTYRPAVYRLSRLPLFDFLAGAPGNADFDPGLIYNTNYSNVVVTNLYAAYSAQIDFSPIAVPLVQGLSITNQPGRVEIQADELNMARTRVRGNTFVLVSTKNLVDSGNAAVDAPNLSFNLASTNGNLKVQNLGRDSVTRLSGFIDTWSGSWTNYLGVVGPDPANPTNMVTNVFNIGIHVLMVDATGITTTQPVLTHDFQSHSTNIVLGDNLQVVDSFLLDGQSFTLNGRLQLSGAVSYFTGANAPTLQYFTNNGTLIIGNAATFGNDRPQPYSTIINNGTMSGPSFAFQTAYFENDGAINSDARLIVTADNARFQNGGNVAGNDVTFQVNDLRFLGTSMSTKASLYIYATNSLEDAGASAGNVWSCQNGFNLAIKPRFGDLFGTTIQSTPNQFAFASHTWAAEDRGATVAGFKDNAAVGRLVLNGNLESFLQFDGAAASGNALYVDFLDFEGLVLEAFDSGDLESFVGIGPEFVVYFADSNVPAEQLDGQLDGRLRWARDFAGPNSSVDVLRLNGQTVKMNRALRFSRTIDSDGDGVVNGEDAYPLDAAQWNNITLTVQGGGQSALKLSWIAAARTAYQVETTTNLVTPNWQVTTSYTNLSLTGASTTVSPPVSTGESVRFYRIRAIPQ